MENKTKKEMVIHPNHYKLGDYDVMFVIKLVLNSMEGKLNPMSYAHLFNVLKYVIRFPEKNGKQDLLKARNLINYLIEEEYGEND